MSYRDSVGSGTDNVEGVLTDEPIPGDEAEIKNERRVNNQRIFFITKSS